MRKLNVELTQYIIDTLPECEGVLIEDLHNRLFNEDHYVIGYYNAKQLLIKWDIDAFNAIDAVKEYEEFNFGEFNTKINSESIVNMLVYIQGEELLNNTLSNDFDGELDSDDISTIIKRLNE